MIPGSRAEEAYLHAVDKRFESFSSIAILTELAGILKRKFTWSEDKIIAALVNISSIATVKRTKQRIHILSDEPDNRILECAASVKADCIVTGDKTLLALGNYGETEIISLSTFLEQFAR